MATIEIKTDGPLAVSGPFELKNFDGKPIVHAEVVVKLCRCGGSQNKPFCDGTHRRNGFSEARIADGSADKAIDPEIAAVAAIGRRRHPSGAWAMATAPGVAATIPQVRRAGDGFGRCVASPAAIYRPAATTSA